MACAPKSNAVYTAWKQALQDAHNQPEYEVPAHLRNAPTGLMKDLGYGEEYRYAHDEAGAYAVRRITSLKRCRIHAITFRQIEA